jgi:ABC-type proline/glycine betaine transport system ATPase subunit
VERSVLAGCDGPESPARVQEAMAACGLERGDGGDGDDAEGHEERLQRVGLARAASRVADVYLLDAPLSALPLLVRLYWHCFESAAD